MKNIFLIILLVFIANAIPAQPCGCDPAKEIVILHVNDMHANIDGMAKLTHLADSIRRVHKNVFLVSAGDNYTGNQVVDDYRGRSCPMIRLMNKSGFDVSVIANHEFDAGQEQLANRMRQARFPFICCNIEVREGGMPQPAPYVILKAGKCKIAFLGAIELEANGIPNTSISNLSGLIFSDGVEKMKEYSWLKDDYVVLIGISHLGLQDDIRLAKAMPQLDLIIGAHSHHAIDTALIVNGVQIVQAGSKLAYAGMMKLHVEKGHVIFRKDTLFRLSAD